MITLHATGNGDIFSPFSENNNGDNLIRLQ